jgi:hypothetical protein
MTIELKAREIVAESHSDTQKEAALSGAYDRTPSFRAARLGIIEGHFIAARLLQEAGEFDAEIIIRRAIERALIEEQKV